VPVARWGTSVARRLPATGHVQADAIPDRCRAQQKKLRWGPCLRGRAALPVEWPRLASDSMSCTCNLFRFLLSKWYSSCTTHVVCDACVACLCHQKPCTVFLHCCDILSWARCLNLSTVSDPSEYSGQDVATERVCRQMLFLSTCHLHPPRPLGYHAPVASNTPSQYPDSTPTQFSIVPPQSLSRTFGQWPPFSSPLSTERHMACTPSQHPRPNPENHPPQDTYHPAAPIPTLRPAPFHYLRDVLMHLAPVT